MQKPADLVDLVKSFPTICARKHPVDGAGLTGADRLGHRAAGVGNAVSRKKEARGAAPGRRKNASSGDQGSRNQKEARVAPREK